MSALMPKERTGYHLSDLTVCPHKKVREEALGYYLPVESAYRMIRGQGWDLLSQQYPRPSAIYQPEYIRDLLGARIEGHPDLIDKALRTIEDYKAPGRNPSGKVYPSYAWQLNGYQWLTAPYRDWEVAGMYLNTCGPTKFERIPVPIWPLKAVEDGLKGKLEALMEVRASGDIRLCDDESCVFCNQVVLWEPE